MKDETRELCESPIELLLYDTMKELFQPNVITIIPQYEIYHYRADFLLRYNYKRIIVEADGSDWHSSLKQKRYDKKRDDYLRQRGYGVMRFTGSEIVKNSKKCATAIWEWIYNGVLIK